MLLIDVKLVSSDDWQALYINNIFKNGAHKLSLEKVIEDIKFKTVMSFESFYINEEILEDKYFWEFPDFFNQFNENDLIKN